MLEDIKVKRRGCIWAVEDNPEDGGEIASKIKKWSSNVGEWQEHVQVRFEDWKKIAKYTFPQYLFWAQAFEVGLLIGTDDPPHGRIFKDGKACILSD